jgi:hypothetical protein
VTIAAVGNRPSTIKPNDLVRTARGRTALVLDIRKAGFRLIEDCVTGDRSIVHVDELYLVRSAPVKRWLSYSLA